jgi:hypothetical protein
MAKNIMPLKEQIQNFIPQALEEPNLPAFPSIPKRYPQAEYDLYF